MIRKGAWGLMTAFAFFVGAYALSSALVPSVRGAFVNALFDDGAWRAFGHLALGGTALIAGALQFSARLRENRPGIHRLLGRVYLAAVLVSGTSALLMAPFSSGGVPAHFGFGLLAVLWLATSAIALLTVRKGDYAAHREWMIRSYALCLAAVTLRIYLPSGLAFGIPFDQAYPAIAWLCWVPNLIVVEWLFVRGPWVPLRRAA